MKFKDKIILITGGGSDISSATTKLLLKEGAKVVLVDKHMPSMENVINENINYKENIEAVVADVAVYEDMVNAVRCCVEKFGKLDVLVCCAGIIKHNPIDMMPLEDWDLVIKVNLTGIFNSCKAAVIEMKKNLYGRIVNISSIGGRTGRPGVGVNYAASKAGIIGITQTLAKELGAWNITVNAIAPGPLKGKLFSTMEPELIEELQTGSPLGRIGEMDDIAYAISYLASDQASWVTGEVLDVNGGMLI